MKNKKKKRVNTKGKPSKFNDNNAVTEKCYRPGGSRHIIIDRCTP